MRAPQSEHNTPAQCKSHKSLNSQPSTLRAATLTYLELFLQAAEEVRFTHAHTKSHTNEDHEHTHSHAHTQPQPHTHSHSHTRSHTQPHTHTHTTNTTTEWRITLNSAP